MSVLAKGWDEFSSGLTLLHPHNAPIPPPNERVISLHLVPPLASTVMVQEHFCESSVGRPHGIGTDRAHAPRCAPGGRAARAKRAPAATGTRARPPRAWLLPWAAAPSHDPPATPTSPSHRLSRRTVCPRAKPHTPALQGQPPAPPTAVGSRRKPTARGRTSSRPPELHPTARAKSNTVCATRLSS